jgi:GNAT superfamily N-acetyltransferase
MARSPSLSTRPLEHDDPAALALAVAAGAHGVYVHNALVAGDGDGFLLLQRGEALGLCWFGRRGNLVVIAGDELKAGEVADRVVQAKLPWRIAMGPTGIVDALSERTGREPLVHRDQVYYQGGPTTAAADLVTSDVRPAQRGDRDRLVQATLMLNDSDLHIDPARVDRRWLRDSIDERIADGTTRVLGPVGSVDSKLDFGSDGPGGIVIEGVFTFPHARGRGLAARLVASCLASAGHERTVLHVGMHNVPARAAYARAGMAPVDRCRLLLLG